MFILNIIRFICIYYIIFLFVLTVFATCEAYHFIAIFLINIFQFDLFFLTIF